MRNTRYNMDSDQQYVKILHKYISNFMVLSKLKNITEFAQNTMKSDPIFMF